MEKIHSDLKKIPVDQILRNPENPRIVFRQEELDQLFHSIKKIGLQVPISVYKKGDKYIILDGERRWKTFLKLNYSTIPAIIQPKPSELDNLLLMFNIHGLREQWDIFTIANKLGRIIDLLRKVTMKAPTDSELANETGLTLGVIKRCKLIIALPQRFKALILTDLHKPKKEQIYSEDLFLEMEASLKSVKTNFPDSIKKIDDVRDVLLKKYVNKTINSIIDFRKITKIATSTKKLNFPAKQAEEALRKIFSDNEYNIEEVYRNSVENIYGDKKLSSNINNFLLKIEGVSKEDLKEKGVIQALKNIKSRIEQILKDA